jgi:hypothetical protein
MEIRFPSRRDGVVEMPKWLANPANGPRCNFVTILELNFKCRVTFFYLYCPPETVCGHTLVTVKLFDIFWVLKMPHELEWNRSEGVRVYTGKGGRLEDLKLFTESRWYYSYSATLRRILH